MISKGAMSACRYAPSTSAVATALPSLASIASEIISASTDTVGEVASSLGM